MVADASVVVSGGARWANAIPRDINKGVHTYTVVSRLNSVGGALTSTINKDKT